MIVLAYTSELLPLQYLYINEMASPSALFTPSFGKKYPVGYLLIT